MAKSLTSTQKAINNDFKQLDENFQLPTPAHYDEYPDFQELIELKEGSIQGDSIENTLFAYDIRLRKMLDNPPHIDELLYQEMTASIFSIPLSNRSLIRRISDSSYADAILLQNEELTKPNNIINLKINTWLNYCKHVNELIEFIHEIQPRWNKMGKVDKKDYIHTLETLTTAPFTQTALLELSIGFLRQYSLNQDALAKANFLLELQLPKITDLKTAKEILKKTTFSI